MALLSRGKRWQKWRLAIATYSGPWSSNTGSRSARPDFKVNEHLPRIATSIRFRLSLGSKPSTELALRVLFQRSIA